MKQVLQDLAKGHSTLMTAPSPMVAYGKLLISTTHSLISAGTERMLVDFGKASYLEKARQQPEKVKMVLEKIKTDGLFTTIDAVRSKLAQPLPLGYCNVGVVTGVGREADGFKLGDRVVSNGPHADMVNVSKQLCAVIPDSVDDESAAFTVVASIGLQGIRLAQPTLGESFVVTGAGLIGLLTIQLLIAQGCRVLAIDFDDRKLQLAKQFGAEICCLAHGEDPVACGVKFSKGRGVDAVIITASTQSNDPVSQAAKMSRKRGRVILVGVTGLELKRADFYEKELSFQVSCSYGPGRYESAYEEQGLDYPIGFVRWTEQRNFEAILDLMAMGKLDISPLITHRYAFEEAENAYQTLTTDRSALGIMLRYTSNTKSRNINEIRLNNRESFDATKPVLGFIGAGNYAARVLLPAFKKIGSQFHTIVTSGGINAAIHGMQTGFTKASTDCAALFENKEINTIVIATRHNSHARYVCEALKAGKNVFVEKPLAINLEELAEIETAYHLANLMEKPPQLMVGFNRRFAPHIQRMKKLLQVVKEPKSFIMTMNAGAIPSEHWTQNPMVGGGRIIGEACHFIDLMRYLAGAEIISVQARRMGDTSGEGVVTDKAAVTLGFADGSFGTIHYLANGAASFPKERIEIFVAGRVLQLDNFRKLKGFGWPGFSKMTLWRQNKGQGECVKQYLSSIEQGLPSPIPISEIFEIAKISIQSAELMNRQ